MQSDLPHTLYNFKSSGPKGQSFSQSDIDEAEMLNRIAWKKAEEKRRQRQQKEGYTINEIFNGDAD
jgi:hypothetical protein